MRRFVLPASLLALVLAACLIHVWERNNPSRRGGDPPSNSCADLELSSFDKGKSCGFPLAYPCFDHFRCLSPPQGPGPRFYIYDQKCSLANSSELPKAGEIPGGAPGSKRLNHQIAWYWRQAAMEAGVLAEAYESACLFVHVKTGHDTNQPCAVHSPLWNGGANHIMVDISDKGR